MRRDLNNLMSKNGHLSDEGMAFYAEKLITGRLNDIHQDVLKHVEDCAECKKQIMSTYDIISKDRKTDLYLKKIESQKILLTNGGNINISLILKVAAVLVISGGLLIFLVNRPSKKQMLAYSGYNSDTTFTTDTIKAHIGAQQDSSIQKLPKHEYKRKSKPVVNKDTNNRLIAESYKESERFETMVNTTFRDVNDFKLIYPENSETYLSDEPIKFEWETGKDNRKNKEIYLVIYNNKEKEVYRAGPFDTSSHTVQNKLNKGLYYWKLENEDEILDFNKFYIN